MRARSLLLALLVLAPSLAAAQKNCKKGIPCGNGCIAANKVCRIGNAAPAPARAPAVQEASTAAPSTTSGPVAMGPWVASSRGRTYYRAGCGGANKLSAQNRIYFKDEASAEAAGYARSGAKGC
jgi:hypothetical protein